ncbi:CoA-binding protein [Halegenticoccus tardaugens]|uniref:CoA-binding protein n=1 Tax=Halegenticoccus tardaugens TaxID=2071624 RepID=UPI00100B502A|nr:CoA-binding protein [Halegenticoccus tardaugens]
MPVTTDDGLRDLLELDVVAVVGCSSTPGKAAHEIPAYLQRHGYDVIPVNPYADEILGREAYDSLADVEEEVDLVDVFRPSEEVPNVVDQVIARKADRGDVRAIWLQLGIEHDEAAARAEEAGLRIVQDRCMKVEHGRLVR